MTTLGWELAITPIQREVVRMIEEIGSYTAEQYLELARCRTGEEALFEIYQEKNANKFETEGGRRRAGICQLPEIERIFGAANAAIFREEWGRLGCSVRSDARVLPGSEKGAELEHHEGFWSRQDTGGTGLEDSDSGAPEESGAVVNYDGC